MGSTCALGPVSAGRCFRAVAGAQPSSRSVPTTDCAFARPVGRSEGAFGIRDGPALALVTAQRAIAAKRLSDSSPPMALGGLIS